MDNDQRPERRERSPFMTAVVVALTGVCSFVALFGAFTEPGFGTWIVVGAAVVLALVALDITTRIMEDIDRGMIAAAVVAGLVLGALGYGKCAAIIKGAVVPPAAQSVSRQEAEP